MFIFPNVLLRREMASASSDPPSRDLDPYEYQEKYGITKEAQMLLNLPKCKKTYSFQMDIFPLKRIVESSAECMFDPYPYPDSFDKGRPVERSMARLELRFETIRKRYKPILHVTLNSFHNHHWETLFPANVSRYLGQRLLGWTLSELMVEEILKPEDLLYLGRYVDEGGKKLEDYYKRTGFTSLKKHETLESPFGDKVPMLSPGCDNFMLSTVENYLAHWSKMPPAPVEIVKMPPKIWGELTEYKPWPPPRRTPVALVESKDPRM